MTAKPTDDDMSIEEIESLTASAADILRRRVEEIEHARNTQPERLVQARSDADVARGWALIEEPLSVQIKTIESIDGRASLALPNITAKELWGARLCFDLLDCGDDSDQIDFVISRLLSAAGGDPGVTMCIMSAALSTIASLVVPQLLQEIELSGSNYDERVRLAEARAKAWNARANHLRGAHDDAAAAGVQPVDGFDIGATALDDPENFQ